MVAIFSTKEMHNRSHAGHEVAGPLGTCRPGRRPDDLTDTHMTQALHGLPGR